MFRIWLARVAGLIDFNVQDLVGACCRRHWFQCSGSGWCVLQASLISMFRIWLVRVAGLIDFNVQDLVGACCRPHWFHFNVQDLVGACCRPH